MMAYLALGLALSGMVAAGYSWYLRGVARRATERAEAAESALAALRSVNTELRAALTRVVADTAARNQREERQDAETVQTAEHDAGAVADLLRGLHQNGPGPGPR